MVIEQMLVTKLWRFRLKIESDDIETHSGMQSLTDDEKLCLRNHLMEVAHSLTIFMPTNGKLG